jgi:hypothetical protein
MGRSMTHPAPAAHNGRGAADWQVTDQITLVRLHGRLE